MAEDKLNGSRIIVQEGSRTYVANQNQSYQDVGIAVANLGNGLRTTALPEKSGGKVDVGTIGTTAIYNLAQLLSEPNAMTISAATESIGDVAILIGKNNAWSRAASIGGGAVNTILNLNDLNNNSSSKASDNKNPNSIPQNPSGSIPNKPTTDIPYNPDPNQPKPNQPKSFEQNFEEGNPGSDVTTIGNNKGRPIYRIELADGTVIYTDNPNSSMIDNRYDEPQTIDPPDNKWSEHLPKKIKDWIELNRDGKHHYYDPLVLDLDGDGIETLAHAFRDGAMFDFNADGLRNATGWVKSDDGILVFDRNNNSLIDSGRELFGDDTVKKMPDVSPTFTTTSSGSSSSTVQTGKFTAQGVNY